MITYQRAFLSEILDGSDIPTGKRAYFQERLRNRFYELVIDEFIKRRSTDPSFTQAKLAKRIGRTPDQICRWLSSPGNWTSDTVSDLLLGICGGELSIGVTPLTNERRNFTKPDWLLAIQWIDQQTAFNVLAVPNDSVMSATVYQPSAVLNLQVNDAIEVEDLAA